MRWWTPRLVTGAFPWITAVCLVLATSGAAAERRVFRFDCGTADSPVMDGYERLTAAEQFDAARGYGWESPAAESVVFGEGTPPTIGGSYGWPPDLREHWKNSRHALNQDAVVCREDLTFVVHVPPGQYRVALTIGDMGQAIGSMDLYSNDDRLEGPITAWAPKSYRMYYLNPGGWSTTVRHTIDAQDGTIRLRLTKNQSYYDEQLALQRTQKTPFALWYHGTPIIQEPPYEFIGAPFIHNSIQAIEIAPLVAPPVTQRDGQLVLAAGVSSPALAAAITEFNERKFNESLVSLARVTEPDAQIAKAIVCLYLAGRPECEREMQLLPEAIQILQPYIQKNPEASVVAEHLQDAQYFMKGLDFHLNRGRMREVNGQLVQRVHFIENDKAIGQWLLIRTDSPLYWKAQIRLGRAAYMLKPYPPMISSEKTLFERVLKEFPDNRFAKYFLTRLWEPYGDGTQYDDWKKEDHRELVKDAPRWVQSVYPAWAGMIEWAEWFARYKQMPEGNIGGGWGDDVEVIGTFGYYGFTSRDAAPLALNMARKAIDGMWNNSEVDPEAGYCRFLADAEHSAEWTGNTLGMMMDIDYGNPVWIERSMKTGKLLRDLWTGYNKEGRRHFKSNYLGAREIGTGETMNDSWINYRAVRPATAVLKYNGNPTIAKLYVELADAWIEAARSTARGKPQGLIPAQVSFPDGIIGGTSSPNWWTASHPPGTDNADWRGSEAAYRGYLEEVLIAAYEATGDAKYVEPIRWEYELAAKHGNVPTATTASRMEIPAEWRPKRSAATDTGLVPGTEEWVGKTLAGTQRWFTVKRMVEGRSGAMENDLTREDAIRFADYINWKVRDSWPMMTTESSATDRVDWAGSCNAFFIYTGGRWGGSYWRAPITYENTTRQFAAAVLGCDTQGFRLLYYSLAPESREIGIIPWELEPGTRYRLTYGPDADGDDKIDQVAEERLFDYPQRGTPVRLHVEPRVNYVVEVDQTVRGRVRGPAPDPGLCSSDIAYDRDASRLVATIHNVGALEATQVKVVFYAGDPLAGGQKIGETVIDRIDAPNDLEPRVKTASVPWQPSAGIEEVFVVVDPDDSIADEITSFNNRASRRLAELTRQGTSR